ncbi:RcnB family protein [Novosphingobium sp. TCA1]|uniref:RcnB family protein n=1 Tax=Novosphingobium sp. TCA1 TaxID=2682474 RepID=UPI00130A2298|nr:RcnB family protein [Novosphingobium sp. TCA1]GFE72842.1 hypothetical protein NTCA1_04910 [Novosphingobium sp. TCA1]
MKKEHNLQAKALLSLSAMAMALAGLAVPTSAMAEPRQERARGEDRSGGERRGGNGGAYRPAPQPQWMRPQARPDVPRPQAPQRAQSAWRGGEQRQQVQQPRPVQDRPQRTNAWSNARPPQAAQPQRPDRAPGQPQSQPSWKSGNRWQGSTPGGWQGARGNDDRRDGDRRWNAGSRPDNRPDGSPNWRNDDNRNDRADRPDRNAWGKDRRDDDRRWNNNDNRPDRPDRNAWGKDRRDDDRRWSGNDNRRWDRNDWRRDNRYDWQHYRDRNRSIYRMGGYYAPYRGYAYRRLSIGFSLGSLFYGSNYWINDPWQYRLPPVYGPYRWVRYYDDVLLVDVYSGEVVDVIYDFFW